MGRAPCCDKTIVKKGAWTAEEDRILIDFIQKNGHENWRAIPKKAGLLRCGKSCRLRWINYLRPDVKRGDFTAEEEEAIIQLHQRLGNRWSAIASRLPGRTDNEIKNVWNTHLKKRRLRKGMTTMPLTPINSPANDLGTKFSASTDSPTTISSLSDQQKELSKNLSDQQKQLSENLRSVSNIEIECRTDDSALTLEWPQLNSFIDSVVGCDEDSSVIGDNTYLENLLKDDGLVSQYQNFEEEKLLFAMQSEYANYFRCGYGENVAREKMMFEGSDEDEDPTNYWLNVLGQVGSLSSL